MQCAIFPCVIIHRHDLPGRNEAGICDQIVMNNPIDSSGWGRCSLACVFLGKIDLDRPIKLAGDRRRPLFQAGPKFPARLRQSPRGSGHLVFVILDPSIEPARGP